MVNKTLMEQAVVQWGVYSQVLMAIEELSELIHALCKTFRSDDLGKLRMNVVEEMADVTLMMEQLKFIFVITAEELQNVINAKTKRLESILTEEDCNVDVESAKENN